jgi:hypothetical protein
MVKSGAFSDLSAELVKDVFKEFAVGMKRKAPALNCAGLPCSSSDSDEGVAISAKSD